jgi:hypothetical protein
MSAFTNYRQNEAVTRSYNYAIVPFTSSEEKSEELKQ